MLKQFLEGYFGFNKQQRNGLLILASVSFILLIVRIVFPYFIHPDAIEIKNLPLLPIEKKFSDSSSQLTNSGQQFADSSLNHSGNSMQLTLDNAKDNLFPFNPNTVSYEQLLQLGLKEKTAKTFVKYRSKGFQFKQKEDLKKVYGINPALYNTIEPYIQFEEEEKNRKTYIKKNSIMKIRINVADTKQLLGVSIIDLSAAKRIIKYRERLGGFVSFNQLKEVYGFDAAYCKKLIPYFEINTDLVKKINPNTSTFKGLNKHPYISEELAGQMLDFRKKTRFNEANFKKLLNDEELFEKLWPYLSFD